MTRIRWLAACGLRGRKWAFLDPQPPLDQLAGIVSEGSNLQGYLFVCWVWQFLRLDFDVGPIGGKYLLCVHQASGNFIPRELERVIDTLGIFGRQCREFRSHGKEPLDALLYGYDGLR